MDRQQIQELAQRFIDALHRLEQGESDDVDAIVALFSENTQLTNSATQLVGDTLSGREGARRFWREYRGTFDRIYSEFYQVTINDRAAGLFWRSEGAYSDGRPVDYDGASLLVFDEDGKIVRFHGYYDTRQVMREETS